MFIGSCWGGNLHLWIRMKKTIINIIIGLILVSLVSAEININPVIKKNESYFKPIHSDWDKKSLYFKNVFSWWYDSYLELKQENQMLKDRITVIETMLNISDISIPEESETDLYRCSYKEDRECLGGLSALNKEGLQTRCYNYLKLGWSTCSTGWIKI